MDYRTRMSPMSPNHILRVGVFLDNTPRVDLNLIAVTRAFDFGKSTGAIKGIPNVTGDDGIARPSGANA